MNTQVIKKDDHVLIKNSQGEYINKKLTLDVLKEYPDECIKLFGNNTLRHLGGVKGILSTDTISLVLRKEFLGEKKLHALSVKFAESVLHLFEDKHPTDDRPRKAIDAKKRWREGKISEKELDVAVNAAYAAAYAAYAADDAAAAAAADAAYAAAYAADYADYAADYAADAAVRAAAYAAADEREKQVKMILEVLK